MRSSHCPLDRTLFISISALPKAYHHWTDLVAHDPPMTDLSLSRSTSPFPSICDHSLFLLLLSVWPNGFVFIFVSLKVYILQFSIIKFVWKLKKWLRKCEKLVENLHFQNVTKHLRLFSNIIFKMQPNTRKYFPFPKIISPKIILHPENILH